MKSHRSLITYLLTGSVLVVATGCRSMKAVDLATDPQLPAFAMVKLGETVDVETQTGKRVRLVVQQVERDAIVSSEGVRYSRSEVAQLKRRSLWTAKTAWLTAGLGWILTMVAGEVF